MLLLGKTTRAESKMTKQDLIDLLATGGKEHAAKLRPFKKAELERFLEEQTDPTNHCPFKAGNYVQCGWSNSSGIILSTEKIPGQGDRYGVRVKVRGGILDAWADQLIRIGY